VKGEQSPEEEGLAVHHLTKSFGEIVALDDLGFSVLPGRIVGFLGPNGAGKTTAMRCILGLLEPDAGSVAWMGHPVDDSTRLEFGYMPEERGLYPKMKIGEQLSYFGRLSGMSGSEAGDATDRWLDRLGLADRAASRLEQLSHGNQQRVQLACALIHAPTLAILDEPFSGLDPIGVDTMSSVLRSVAEAGTAVLFSSHQLDLVEDICEDVVVVESGRVVLSGELERLRAAAPVRHLEIDVNGVRWNGRRGEAVTADIDLDEVLRDASIDGRVTRVVFEPPSLTDLFREAVRK
jgi:ABC-2 type transport system ATP-binding protein